MALSGMHPGHPAPWSRSIVALRIEARSGFAVFGGWLRKGDPVIPGADIYMYIYYNVYTYIICVYYICMRICIYIYCHIQFFLYTIPSFFGGCCTHICSMYDLSTDLGDVWGD